jgi:hypothetical protein
MTTQLDTQTRGHHPDSPSSLQSSEACPHFLNEQRESQASIDGTLQHKAAETRSLDLLDSIEQQHAVQKALTVEDNWIAQLTEMAGQKPVHLREVYLPVGDDLITAEDQVWLGVTGGYPDTVLVVGPLAVILDWKFGKIFVTATAKNLQGMAYARALFERYPGVDEVLVQFFHPYLEEEPLPEYSHVFKREEMEQIELHIRYVVARKQAARAEGLYGAIPPVARTNLCLWCANKAECPALAKIFSEVSEKHEAITVPETVKSAELKTPADYAAVLRVASIAELWAKAVKRRATDAVLTEDMQVPGYELVRRQEREIHSVKVVRDEAIRSGLTLEEFDNCLSLPITKVETLIADKAKLAGEKAAPKVREFQDRLEESGAVTLSPGATFLKESRAGKSSAKE